MKKTLLMFVLVLGLSLHLSLALSRADMSGLAERVIEHQLSNGMKVLMVERHQTPVVSINLTFGVGGMNEHTGRTGVAHLYEHMAFKGTRMVGTKDYEKERPLLEELHRLGTEIERRQREAAVKTSGRPSSAGAPAREQHQQRL
jgi:predicted Zn-dependent peptidase